MEKPRIKKSGELYFCSALKGLIGYGSTAQTAYFDWMRLNRPVLSRHVVWKIKPAEELLFGTIPLKF